MKQRDKLFSQSNPPLSLQEIAKLKMLFNVGQVIGLFITSDVSIFEFLFLH
jgi:hypothetical protein